MLRYPELDLRQFGRIALDTETTGLNWPVDQAFGFSLTTAAGSGYWDIRREPQALNWLRDQMRQYRGLVILFNATFDMKMLWSRDVFIDPALVDDVAIRASLIDEHRATPFPWLKRHRGRLAYTLDALAEDCLGERKHGDIYAELARLFGGPATRAAQAPNFQHAPPELMAPYAIRDTELTYRLWDWQQPYIARPDEYGRTLEKIAAFERRVFPEVLKQEMGGIRVDVAQAAKAQAKLHRVIDRQKLELAKLTGTSFNVNSVKDMRDWYQPVEVAEGKYQLGNGHPCGTTGKGGPSINNEVLQSLAKLGDKVADLVIQIRSNTRTADTFLAKHVIGHAINGRVYPNINQVASEQGGTKTGRFSYTDPALQQIPNRNQEVAAIVKPVFLPDEGQVWLDGDMNGFEVRTFAHLVSRYNRALQRTYEKDPNTDFHGWVADLMGVPRNPQPDGGANAKQLNLSMIFNSGKGAIAHALGLPTRPDVFEDEHGQVIHFHRSGAEGERVIEQYHARVRGVKDLADACKERAEKRGYLITMYGRHLRFPKKYKSYKASGILIQATAAEINKENWCIIGEALGDRGRLMLNTHDSYSMSVDEDKVDEVWADVKREIERPVLRVPLILDLNGVGDNWWEAVRKDK